VLSFDLQTRSARLLKRGTSGSVQRGPANPARPGREQRYRVSQVCRGDPEVPRFERQRSDISDQETVGFLGYVPACPELRGERLPGTVLPVTGQPKNRPEGRPLQGREKGARLRRRPLQKQARRPFAAPSRQAALPNTTHPPNILWRAASCDLQYFSVGVPPQPPCAPDRVGVAGSARQRSVPFAGAPHVTGTSHLHAPCRQEE